MRIIVIPEQDIHWDFDGAPAVSLKPACGYGRNVPVDPFPAYPHEKALVAKTAEHVLAAFPIGFDTSFYILPRELPSRTNGYASRDWTYGCECAQCKGAGTERRWSPYVVLQAKRIPPHPAMTRYLIAHEYGHIVQYWIEHKRGITDATTTEFDLEYMKLRPGSNNEYGGGRWHSNVGELIANDFRICVTRLEPDFWPHKGFPHPDLVPEVQEFWKQATAEFSYRADEAKPAELRRSDSKDPFV